MPIVMTRLMLHLRPDTTISQRCSFSGCALAPTKTLMPYDSVYWPLDALIASCHLMQECMPQLLDASKILPLDTMIYGYNTLFPWTCMHAQMK